MNTAPPPSSDQPTEQPTGQPTGQQEPTGQPAGGPTGPRVTRDQALDLGRLRRSRDDVRIAGVASGLARHLDLDPTLMRVLLVVLAFFGGAGLIIYVAAWLLVPEEGTDDRPLSLDDRNRGIALAVAGIVAALAAVSEWAGGGSFWFPWPILLVVLGYLWFTRRGERTASAAPGTYGAVAPAAYDETGAPIAGYAAPPAYAPRRPNPRKRGPVLFWPVLATIALAVGTLGVIDVSGVDVVDSAYPALALGITALGLLVGAFWGRAGGLILVGFVAAAATAAATIPSHWDGETINERPTSASDVRDHYELDAGDLVLDLSAVNDAEELDGHQVEVDGGFGRIEVVVPDDIDVTVNARVGGPGDVSMFGEHTGGINSRDTGFAESNSAADMTIDIDLGVGEIVVIEK